MFDWGVIEGTAAALCRAAGQNTDSPTHVVELARCLLGPTAVQFVPPRALRGDAALGRIGEDWRIYARRGLSPVRLRFAVAHELAHWALGLDSSCDAHERACDALAAALVVPRAAYARALGAVGHEYHRLAECFGVTESCVVLRHGEVTGAPLALVAPSSVRVRGEGFDWPAELELRQLASARRPGPGIVKARLRDDPQRIILQATG